MGWELVTDSPGWEARDSAEGVVFDGAMWLSGGYGDEGSNLKDVWRSYDGERWEEVVTEAPYDAYAELVEYQGKLWAIKQSVWVSVDGSIWVKVTDTPFGEQPYGEVVVWRGNLWQLGSGDKIYRSSNGIDWQLVQGKAAYGDRFGAEVVVYRDRLWVLGGSVADNNTGEHYDYLDDRSGVWVSDGGITFNKAVEAPWPARMWFGACEYDGFMYVMGGYSNTVNENLNDMWRTQDGYSWEKVSENAGWNPRHAPTLWIYRGDLFLGGGNMWPLMNDVWRYLDN
jgi:hypothetical protein